MMETFTANDDRVNLQEFLEEAELQQYHELFRDILKVTKVSQLKFVVTEDLVQIGLSKPEQRRYKKIYSKYFPNPYITKIRKLLTATKKNDGYLSGHSSLSLEFQPFPENNVKVPTKHIIPVEDISINKELGMGQFGVVQQGTWSTGNQRIQVAIKCLGNERMTSNSTEFLKEAAVMHSIEHPNIVRLYGVVLHLDSLMLVTELAPLRSLLECLREVSLRPSFPVPTLCEFAEQICDGMTYLENKRLIHRDLAARNILVFSKDRVKISDFGLSRALGVGKDYYQTNYNVNLKLPVAWCAPECILYLRFTSASDVWAFGVCLWEMFTYGFQPWAAFSGHQILDAIDAPNAQRLERPECCPQAYYTTMLECWSHDPNDRPKFRDLVSKLRDNRPEQVQTISGSLEVDGRRNNFLEYKAGQIITVLGKESMTNTSMWYGVLPVGSCGIFDPNNITPYSKTERQTLIGPLSPNPTRNSSRLPSLRSSLLRSDVKRHTIGGKRTIERSMISSPQGEVKHTGHVGLDGAYFGDISFLDPAGCPPKQIVTPYKPSEDLEQVPLINPNSPSHLSAASSASAYPLLCPPGHEAREHCNQVNLPHSGDSKPKSLKKLSHKSVSEPTTSKSIMNKVKSATLGRSYKHEDGTSSRLPTTSKCDELHEYHEISDTDMESNAPEHHRDDNLVAPDSPVVPKSYGDFSQSLLDEMESMFKSLDSRSRREDANALSKNFDIDGAIRSHTLTKLEKKKGHHTGTMKPMSAHDQRTLDTAVALANEITTKSMNDLDNDVKVPASPSEKSRFHFKFPSKHHNNDAEHNGKQDKRNFSKEANSVQDIQASLTEESKQAYASLIEQPAPCGSLVCTMPKSSVKVGPAFHSLQKPARVHKSSGESVKTKTSEDSSNELPLPPRTNKTKMTDKTRHVRKYPLKMPANGQKLPDNPPKPLIIYQNTVLCPPNVKNIDMDAIIELPKNGNDVFDGVDLPKTGTNPFKNCGLQDQATNYQGIMANPFNCFIDTVDGATSITKEPSEQYFEEGSLVKDCVEHVSVEDLLEFSEQKPMGRQRGAESDEVRIMSKVLKQETTPEQCLEALELSDWNVHLAIKVSQVKLTATDATLEQCASALDRANGEVIKASVSLINNANANNI